MFCLLLLILYNMFSLVDISQHFIRKLFIELNELCIKYKVLYIQKNNSIKSVIQSIGYLV